MAVIDVTARYPLADVWWRGAYGPEDITDIAIHHTMTGETPADASVDDELAVLDCIYAFHVNTRVFGGIGYHGVAFASGRSYLTCPLTRWGAHVADENNHLWGFAAAGDYTNGHPPVGILEGLRDLVFLAADVTLPLRPHLAWGGTSCPGAQWKEWVPWLRHVGAIAEEDDMTDEQHAMLQTIHHMAKLVVPAEHKAIIGKLDHIHAHLEDLKNRNEAICKQLRSDIAAIGAVSGPTADAIAAKIADELAKRLLA